MTDPDDGTQKRFRRSGRTPRDSSDRVRVSHAQTRITVRLALLMIVVAALCAVLVDQRWLALHIFFAGTVMLAISGVSVMLTVTWSAAPAPPNALMTAQRIAIGAGALGIGFGRHFSWGDAVVGGAAALYLVGLLLLAWALFDAARSGTQRRFDPAIAAYFAAIAAGVAGVIVGAWMAIDQVNICLRSAHTTANLLGLIGLVVGGTMPFFAATVGRSKMAPHATQPRLFTSLAWQVVALGVAMGGLVLEQHVVAGIGFLLYVAGIATILHVLPRPTKRQLQWAGPRVIALWLGGVWWAISLVMTATTALQQKPVFVDQWVAVLAIAGYGQILWGSLAYLLPMLRGGGHERLSEGFAATRSWFGLALVNLAGISLSISLPSPISMVLIAAWIGDSAWRAMRIGTTQAE